MKVDIKFLLAGSAGKEIGMNGKQRIQAILGRKPSDRHGFWMGTPTYEARENYMKYFGVMSGEELSDFLGDDLVWISAGDDAWKHPEGKPVFDFLGGKERVSLDQPGIFADCESIDEIERYEWPNPEYLDFSSMMNRIEKAGEKGLAVFGGMWSCFFHDVTNFFGMENCFIKMITDPEVVEAASERIVDFYYQANKKCFDLMGSNIDVFFFGNDLGSQEDLLISPDQFKRFVLPGVKRLTEQAKSYGLKVALHSCGSIARVIPMLVDAGIDILHPIQARAKGMDAATLAREYGRDLVFLGGVDTQELLPFGTPEQVKDEVRRLKQVLGRYYIVSPSHEALLSNVSPENLLALRNAAMEDV